MTAVELMLACALDAVCGDPRWVPHPVRLMGCGIAWLDGRVRLWCRNPASLRGAGLVLAAGLPCFSYAAGWLAIEIGAAFGDWVGKGVAVVLAYTTLAARDLIDHVRAVERALVSGNLLRAREAVSLIVGRDTRTLDEVEIIRATVETIAENASDGIIAPLFYLTLGGAPLALAYKAVNTLDSMIGHRDARYEHFGWASARLDDLANWLPARLTACLIVAAAGLLTQRLDVVNASWRILRRDGHRHPSPNSGRPEAAMAGVLGVQLGGVNYYDGRPSERPRLGDPRRALAVQDIRRALHITIMTAVLGVLLALLVLLR
ncbi:MAG TPA: adenosylcobinamide-phosphate synthase CbiB [Nitrospiraceae bacterium]|jgi:adenosylcobinamide-phosphate synthase|nr:adenosylcobinamide-phosphate synthase CbiB [Nitrospiraceae bacterium]